MEADFPKVRQMPPLDAPFDGFQLVKTFKSVWYRLFSYLPIHVCRYDQDRSGTVEHHELSNIIHEMGFNLSPQGVQVCIARYSKHSNNQVSFDDFVACGIRVRAMSTAFKARDHQGQGFANLSYDDFMCMVMKC